MKYVKKIYRSGWVTNYGPLHEELREKLRAFLNVPNIVLTANGTIALQIAYRVLGLNNSRVITTPFSFVATLTSLIWSNCEVIFADIDKNTFNIDVNLVEDILKRERNVRGVVATHVFGNPCDIEALEYLGERYNVRIVFDASHCFNVHYREKNILNFGDASVISFHATKVFHTIEGGGIVFRDESLATKARKMANFGFESYYSIPETGINGKMNEFEAAMGLANLKFIDEIIRQRKRVYDTYMSLLKKSTEHITFQERSPHATNNYAYFPVVFSTTELLERCLVQLGNMGIYPRRYYYPPLHKLPWIQEKPVLPVCESISSRIVCLPMYAGLSANNIRRIVKVIMQTIGDG